MAPVGFPSTATAVPPVSRASAALRVVTQTVAVPRTPRGWGTAAITLATALLLLVPVGAALQVVLSGQFDDRTPSQAIVVMNTGSYWGDRGPVLRSRLEHAAELYRQGVAPVVMVTGTARGADEARAILQVQGVPSDHIVAFTTGGDTTGTLEVIAAVMRDLDLGTATVVTDPAQAARTQATASTLGIDAHVSPVSDGPGTALTSEYVGRETMALLRFYAMTRWALPQVLHQS